MRKLAGLGLAALTTAVILVSAMPAAAGDDREIIRTGNCSGASDWKLKLKLDDGRIETEFEVDQNRNWRRWRVVLRRDGAVFFRGIRTTRPPSGSFEVERRPLNRPGTDRISRVRSVSAAARSAAARRPSRATWRSGWERTLPPSPRRGS